MERNVWGRVQRMGRSGTGRDSLACISLTGHDTHRMVGIGFSGTRVLNNL